MFYNFLTIGLMYILLSFCFCVYICNFYLFATLHSVLFKLLFSPGNSMQHAELPWPRIKPVAPAVEVPSLNHWTIRKVLNYSFVYYCYTQKQFLFGCWFLDISFWILDFLVKISYFESFVRSIIHSDFLLRQPHNMKILMVLLFSHA